jgi:transcriptional regulator with XRE-family HTH domain
MDITRFSEILLKNNTNQSQTARAARVHKITLWRMLNGEADMTIKILQRVCTGLGVSIDIALLVCLDVPTELMPAEQEAFKAIIKKAKLLMLSGLDLHIQLNDLDDFNV